MHPPSIERIDKNGGRPVITGSFDAMHTRILRITFGGRVYQLDLDAELTATENEWRLDLSELEPPLRTGGYVILVEAVGYDNTVKTASRTIFFLFDNAADAPEVPAPIISDKENDGEPVGPDIPRKADRPTPDIPGTGVFKELLLPVTAVLATGASLFAWSAFVTRRVRLDK